MLTTAVSILAAIALLLPGFIVVELANARGARASRSDLELAPRALAYTLIFHALAAPWTIWLVDRVEASGAWHRHTRAIVAYVATVLIAVPIVVGLLANLLLAKVEIREGPPPLWAAAPGAGEARDAYDYAFQRLHRDGGWVIVELVGHTEATPKLVGGLYGRGSAVGQSPAAHDLYLQRLCLVETRPNGVREFTVTTDEPRGVWIAASQIARLEILPAGPDSLE